MANNQNRDMIVGLLKIGAKYLLPIAKEAFYEYRDRLLEAAKVSDEERAILLEWVFDDDAAPTPADPVPPVTPPTPPPPTEPDVAKVPYLQAFDPPVPDDAVLRGEGFGFVAGDQVCADSDNAPWMVAAKGSSRLGAKLLRVIGTD